MNNLLADINEWKTNEAFSRQAPVFDRLYRTNAIIRYKRQRVREHVMKFLQPGSKILELNCGTGEDAIFFAEQGHIVHATDLSEYMLEQLKSKLQHTNLQHRISFESCSFTKLHELQFKGPFDLIFSNFGGLNCTGELETVLSSLPQLLRPNGRITLVVISQFCLWELLLVFRGKFKTALRRFTSSAGQTAIVEGKKFTCWYYSPADIMNHLKGQCERHALEALCTIVPPSYIENFAKRHPRLFTYMVQAEQRFKSAWPWKYMGDYFIITLTKK